MCFYFVERCHSCACSLLKLYRACAVPSGEFHLGPRDVVHDDVVAGNKDIDSGQRQASTAESISHVVLAQHGYVCVNRSSRGMFVVFFVCATYS